MGSSPVKEKAAAVVEALTVDPGNAWAVLAYSIVPALVEACRTGSPMTHVHVSGVLKNIVVVVEDLQEAIVEEGAVPVLVEILGADVMRPGVSVAIVDGGAVSDADNDDDIVTAALPTTFCYVPTTTARAVLYPQMAARSSDENKTIWIRDLHY